MSDMQREHVVQVERLLPDLSALRKRICPGLMPESTFWKLYFARIHPELNAGESEILSTNEGYFQSLFSCIEKLLGSLKVKHFVIPSADEAKFIWTKKFGFSKITPDQLREYAKGSFPMIFQGSTVVASVEDKLEIVASRKVKIVADMLLDEAVKLQYDLIVLPGGLPGAQAFSNSEKLANLLKRQAESNKLYGAICASLALVLEPHGLLKGKKATAFIAMCSKLSDQSECENRAVVDGNLITSRGPGTSMEFALAIVEKFFSR